MTQTGKNASDKINKIRSDQQVSSKRSEFHQHLLDKYIPEDWWIRAVRKNPAKQEEAP